MSMKSNNTGFGKLAEATALASTLFCCIFVSPVLANEPEIRPPADTQLAFVRDDQIWLVNSDGTGLIQLTDTEPGVANRDPAWSRDGQRLAFARRTLVSEMHEFADIYIMNADGSNVVKLTDEGYNIEPTWGPDDHTIAFSSRINESLGLAVVDTNAVGSQGPTILLDRPGGDYQPAWSPDGRTITFTSDYRFWDFVSDIWALNQAGEYGLIMGSAPGTLGHVEYYQSAWSPDGQSIAVVACPHTYDFCYPDNASAIVVANADGSGLKEIAQAGGYQVKPTWSPDGRWIAYGSSLCHTCESSIRYVQVDGGIEGHITDNGHSPSWRPQSGAPLNAGHSGAWYNPATSAQGQFLDVNPDSQFVFLGWPTYTDDESDNPNEQHWFTAQGDYNGSKADLILYESVGGQFDDPQVVSTTAVGNATLIFSGCDQGRMSYRFDDRDLQGSFPIIRAIPGSGDLCESLTESTMQAVNVNHGMDGAWIDVSTSGQGFFFDIHADAAGGRFIFASWLTYGDGTASGQRWLTAQGPFEGDTADLVIYESSGGSFNSPEPAETVAVGTLHIEFSDCSHALLNYSLPGEGIGGTSYLQRAVPGGQSLCQELDATR